MHVLEHEHGRAVLAERLEKPAPRGKRLHPAALSRRDGSGLQPHQRSQVTGDPLAFPMFAHDGVHGLTQLLRRRISRVRLEDPGFVVDHLSECAQNATPSPYASDRPRRHRTGPELWRAPNNAITPSPMNLATTPPVRSTDERSRRW